MNMGGQRKIRTRPLCLHQADCSLGLDDLAALDALGAKAHAPRVALAIRNAHVVQVRKEATRRNAGGVQTDAALVLGRTLADDGLASCRTLSAHITYS